MSHDVEQMFSVGQTPWHKLGVILQGAPTTADGIKHAGLDWHVEKRPVLYTKKDLSHARASGFNAMVRCTDDTCLGIVGENYAPLQNKDAFSWFDPFLQANTATLESAGSLRNGKVVWILAKLTGAPLEIRQGDYVDKYLLLSNSHDGSQAIRVGFTPTRVVCNNTLTMAHNGKDSQLLRVWHSKKAVVTLSDIRETVSLANQRFEATAAQFKRLASRPIDLATLDSYVKQVFYPTLVLDAPEITERQRAAVGALTDRVVDLFAHGQGNGQGTVWDAYNAVTQHLTHDFGRSDESRLASNWNGSAKVINMRALEAATQLAA